MGRVRLSRLGAGGAIVALTVAVGLGVLSAAPAAPPKHRKAKPDAIARLIATGLPVYCGGGTKRLVALTFDDGPGPYTQRVLDLLAESAAPSTFFLIGRNVVHGQALVQQEVRQGAALGDHTWSHPQLANLRVDQIRAELQRARRLIQRVSGRPVRLFRPPFGDRNPVVDRMAKRLGLLEVLWSADSGDASEPSTPTPDKIYANLAARVHPGSIVLMHENITGEPDYYALKQFLPELRRRGLTPVTVPTLLTRDPPTLDQLRGGEEACSTAP